jgi:hypothetical protein
MGLVSVTSSGCVGSLNQRHVPRVHPFAVHGQGGGFGADLLHSCRCQIDAQRAEVFFEVVDVAAAGDGNDEGALGQQPRQGDLGGGGILRFGPSGEEVDEGPVCLQVLWAPSRETARLSVVGSKRVRGSILPVR